MPEQGYSIKLDIFEGPLDLLLHLIKKNELDIYDIPIALITEQYLAYIELMKILNLEIAGEFISLAATLMYIKSKTMLPCSESEDYAQEEDPRAELRDRLLEYQKYKELALHLESCAVTQQQIFSRQTIQSERIQEQYNLPSLEVNLFDLLSAFKYVLDNTKEESLQEIDREQISINEKISEIMEELHHQDGILFINLFKDYRKLEVIITFLALLELIKLNMIRAIQRTIFSDIRIYLAVKD